VLKNYVLEVGKAPGINPNIVLAGASTDRLTWRKAYADNAVVFYFADDGAQAEWGVGTLHYGPPDSISRDTIVGNTIGNNNTSRLNFAQDLQLYNEIPGERLAYINGNVLWAPGASLDPHAGGVPIGASMDFWGTVAPTGWQFLDGRWLGRVQYAMLFAVLSTTYGAADGSQFFALPDCQGSTTYGKNIPAPGGYASNFALGPWQNTQMGGVIGDWRLHQHSHTPTVTDGQHSHGLNDPGHNHTYRHTDFVNGTNFVPGSGYTQVDSVFTTTDGLNVPNVTRMSMNASSANISVAISTSGAGIYQNVSPGVICNKIIFSGPVP
jgi:microcystin-dependent protein